jgi:hypothetical protein
MKNRPERYQNDDVGGLKRLGGAASETADRIPSDIGSAATEKINRELEKLNPNPVKAVGGDSGGRQFADSGEAGVDSPYDSGAFTGNVGQGLRDRQFKGKF